MLLVVIENNDFTLLRSQYVERFIEHLRSREATLPVGDVLGPIDCITLTGGDPVGLTARSILLEVVDQQPARNREQPSAESIPFVETLDVAKYPNEGILDDVLSQIRPAADSEEETVQPSLMRFDQLGERTRRKSVGRRDVRTVSCSPAFPFDGRRHLNTTTESATGHSLRALAATII